MVIRSDQESIDESNKILGLLATRGLVDTAVLAGLPAAPVAS